ncbi:DUF4160 domain-containing protein [Magnetospirillum sp. UT-4]|uniref:DUF4160 domain-containing protein n=1 Tax=Magnetospirillum sp. UT-4 TaxID=2681467 RepID=UPI001384309C|nr:DUF4160 domain-containing protein [Magnetospirillum sp. UT-4]CAA7613348.1 conserved hypothetical protein [Magnetospirillum sp. UT-4]
MPEISRFLGMIISMYYDDHAPPHFHVRYGEREAVIRIEDLACTRGDLSPRAMGLVIEWAALHRNELMEDWRLARQEKPLNKIAPLE